MNSITAKLYQQLLGQYSLINFWVSIEFQIIEAIKAMIMLIAQAWAHEGAGQYALKCSLMSGYGYQSPDNNVIFGPKIC